MLKYSVELSEIDLGFIRVGLLISIEQCKKLAQGLEDMIDATLPTEISGFAEEQAVARRDDVAKMRRILSELYRLSPILPQGGEKNHV